MEVKNYNKGFESVPRDIVFDESLSFKARFLYIYMTCKPVGWEFHFDAIAKEMGCTVKTLKTYMSELVSQGWVVIGEQEKDAATGQFKECMIILPNFVDVAVKKQVEEGEEAEEKNDITADGKKGTTAVGKNFQRYNKEIKNNKEINKEKNKDKSLLKKISPEEQAHDAWFKENFPILSKNTRPLKYKTMIALQASYTKKEIIMKLNEMESKVNFNRKYSDVGRVLYNWLERDKDPNFFKRLKAAKDDSAGKQ